MKIKKVLIPLAEGFEEIEAISIVDVLRRAEINVTIVSVTGKIDVNGSHQIRIRADELFENINFSTMDMIVLPGGMPGSKNLNLHEGLKRKILEFNNAGKPIGAICAAPMVLGHLGLLRNRKSTCYPGFETYLTGAEITGDSTTLSGNIITGKGAGVAILFALKIVEMLKGRESAITLAETLLAEFK